VVAVRNRRLQFGVVVLVVAATAGLLTQLGLGGSDKVVIGTGSVSALAHPARTTDALPQSVLDYPFAERNFASPSGGGSRLLQEQGSLKLYAVPGKSGMLCLVEVDSAAQTAGGACADRDVLRTGSIYMADTQEDGSRLVVGLVGDGHTYAEANGRRATVEKNSFVLRQVEGGDLTVGSPTASQHIDIGG
jgi:hypothetical protein